MPGPLIRNSTLGSRISGAIRLEKCLIHTKSENEIGTMANFNAFSLASGIELCSLIAELHSVSGKFRHRRGQSFQYVLLTDTIGIS